MNSPSYAHPQKGLSEAWRLCCLPGVSYACQASQAAALRKKAWLAEMAFWRSITGGKMIFGKMIEMEG
jgi:hypothetical protein